MDGITSSAACQGYFRGLLDRLPRTGGYKKARNATKCYRMAQGPLESLVAKCCSNSTKPDSFCCVGDEKFRKQGQSTTNSRNYPTVRSTCLCKVILSLQTYRPYFMWSTEGLCGNKIPVVVVFEQESDPNLLCRNGRHSPRWAC